VDRRQRGDVGRDQQDRAVPTYDRVGQLSGRGQLQRLGAIAGRACPVEGVRAQGGPQRVVGGRSQPRA
jgi:hypothetical protein